MSTRELRYAFFEGQQARLETRLSVLRHAENRYPWLRLAAFLAGVSGIVVAFQAQPLWLRWAWTVLFVLGFSVLTYLHRRVINAIRRYETLLRLSLAQSARMRLDWDAIPVPQDVHASREHPFELDLNITGERSLMHLLDTSVSRGGSDCLRAWLLARAPLPDEIARRQARVVALLARYGFRARLGLAGATVTQGQDERWDGESLLAWLRKNTAGESYTPILIVLGLLAVVNITLFALNLAGLLPPYWAFSLLVFWGVQGLKYRQTGELFSDAYYLGRTLDRFRAVMVELERSRFEPGDALGELCRPFQDAETCPSRLLRSLGRIISAAGLRNNPFLGLLLNSIVPWDIFFTARLEAMKRRLAGLLPRWLDTWYQLEALGSLANYAFTAPESTFPRILAVEAAGGEPVLAAEGLGHPLIAHSERVCNDFSVPRLGQITIVTGSNMSGKSTFLRTLGVNLALAFAGGTVCARRLECLPLRLYSSITVSDSLSEGVSYFYAEVRRLKGLLDALNTGTEYPLFFLIDEIFRGTNNRERRIGSQAYTQALAGKFGAGVISTHDLELVRLEDEIAGVRNFHFREDIRAGKMVFDYRLRPGPSPTTNALKIMALEGLPVGDSGTTD